MDEKRNLYFDDSHGRMRVVALNVTEKQAVRLMYQFCEQRMFKVYYVRSWNMYRGRQYDVGSHTEFFYWSNNIASNS